MKNYFLGGLLVLGVFAPLMTTNAAPDGWVLGSPISQSNWIANVPGKCDTVVENVSCDYTGPSKALRLGYEYEFADEFWAGSQSRRLKNFCVKFQEQADGGDYNQGDNPIFNRTPQLINNNNWVNANTSMVVLKADRIYQINAVPGSRSSNNLSIKYVIEYANDEAATTRYQHTECYPYEISRCGDGVVDTDWFKKDPSDPAEECDYNDPSKKGWEDGSGKTCSKSCKIEYETPACNSDYNGKKVYQKPTTPYLNGTELLCKPGTIKAFKQEGTPIKFTWGCELGPKFTESDACSLNQYWCGDGLVNQPDGRWDNYINGSHYEACDPTASEWKNKTNGEKCNDSCSFDKATCGSKKGTTEYNSNFPTGRITASSEGLCGLGKLVEGSFSGPDENGKYKWKCINGTKESDVCEAQDLRCGDGKKNGTEVCDPKDPNHENWGDGCSATCEKTYGDAVCGSVYNGQTKYQHISNEWLNKNTPGLCDKGEVVEFSLDKTTGKYTWKCKNGSKTSDVCTAQQLWCGDGKKQNNETCDPKDPNHENWGDSCSATCQKVYNDALCGTTYYEKEIYQDVNNQWLNENTPGLCDNGKVVNFSFNKTTGKYEWQCQNGDKVSPVCPAQQLWCGNGKLETQYGEECDGGDYCDTMCKKITPPEGCTSTFTGSFRLGDKHLFEDNFSAGWHDRYIYYKDVNFVEHYGDHNNGANPSFDWSQELKNNGMKVPANTKNMVGIRADSEYNIIKKPTQRAWNNIEVEYAVWYGNEKITPAPAKTSLYSHKECAYYEIRWCGDGVLDTADGEECDPGSEGTKVMSDGRICNSECKIEEAPSKGKLKIEKTLKDKKTVEKVGEELIWQIKVVADGGDVKDFKVQDLLPTVLDYVSYSVVSNPDNLTLTGPTGPVKSGSNNVYTWDVTGTLKSGGSHELIIEVKSKVNTMPKSNDDFRNVACVIKGNDKECDDAKPGTWDIKKTLLSPKEITKTGDLVIWSLKVTVDGGEVKNPLIKDILPPVLGYKDYLVVHNPGVEISAPVKTTVTYSGQTLEQIEWKTNGTLKDNDYIEIQLTTYVKTMPDKKYDNVLCVDPENEDEKCDDEPLHNPLLRIKKSFSDGSKEKTVKVGETIEYKVQFGNKGTAPATITSIKDFLPKNVKYISSEIFVDGEKVHTNDTQSGETSLFNGFKVVDGVYIDIYGGITLNPGVEGYILIKGEVLSDNQTSTQNWACIYLNDKKPDDSIIDGNPCDDAIHHLGGLICSKEDFKIETTSFTNAGGSTSVSCGTSPKGEIADTILIDCGNGTTYTKEKVASLNGTCTYPANTSSSSVSYNVQCKVNNVDSSDCKGTVTVPGQSTPSSCFIAGTKVMMADGTEKNIEEVKVGEKIIGENGVNTVLGYDRPVLGTRHLWSINGGEYFVSDEHPFKTTEGWKSFNPEMTKLEIDLNTTELKVGDVLITKNGLEEVKTIDYIEEDYNTPLYNFILDGDHTYYANGYLVHNKNEPYCTKPKISGSERVKTVVCETDNGRSANIKIDCGYGNQVYTSTGKVTSLTGTCDYTNAGYGTYQILCYADDKNLSHCNDNVTYSAPSSCFVAGTKVTMADGTKKNIEDVKIGEKVLGTDGSINTVLGYDRPSLGNRHLWSINGGEYFVSDEHPFKTTEGWKSFNPEMTKFEIDLNTTELKVGDKIVTENGLEEIKTVSYINEKADTQLYNFILDGDHTYHANGYLVHNKGGGSCFIAGTKVVMADGTEKNIEDVKVGEKIMGENGVNTVLGYDRPILRSRHLWSINGGEYFVSDEHPFKTTEGWKSFNPEMTKLEIDLNTTELKVGDVLVTKSGLEEVKTIDYIDEDYNTPLYNFVLDGDHTYYANGYLVHNKGGGTTVKTKIYSGADCYNVNAGQSSIEEGEILPFFWNIKNLKDYKDWVYEFTGYGYPQSVEEIEKGIYKQYSGQVSSGTCSSDRDGFIALNSMICTFKVLDPKGKLVKTIESPCLRDNKGMDFNYVSEYPLVNEWMDWAERKYGKTNKDMRFYWSFTNKDNDFHLRSNINYFKIGTNLDVLGEYKLKLASIRYLQCKYEVNKKWEDVTENLGAGECEHDFTVTNSYTVQKTPAGNVQASNTQLSKYYKYMDDTSVFADLLSDIVYSEAKDYTKTESTTKAMQNFINKYEKLAVKVNNPKGGELRKVPGKDIYFVYGEASFNGNPANIDKPFTVVQKNKDGKGGVTIKGSLNHNMMLLAEGDITFEGNCWSYQEVKGIFYTERNLNRRKVDKNNDLNNNHKRCDYGGLHVRGVLIGGGLQTLMNNSRSNLNGWFDDNKSARTVMNGASVLIEYSPSVFTKATMPPGAEEFTTALSIYKN